MRLNDKMQLFMVASVDEWNFCITLQGTMYSTFRKDVPTKNTDSNKHNK